MRPLISIITACIVFTSLLAVTAPTPLAAQEPGAETPAQPLPPLDDSLVWQDVQPPPPPPPRRGERGPRDEREDEPLRRGPEDGFGEPPLNRGDFRRPRPVELSPEEIDERLEILKELRPELGERLEALRAQDPDKLPRMLASDSPRLSVLVETKKNDPEMYALMVENVRLERAAHDLARRYRQAVESEQAAPEVAPEAAPEAEQIRIELVQSIEKHFDVRQQMRERELHNLEQRLEQMRASLAARREARDRLIAQRVEQLSGDRNERVEF